MDAAYQIVLIAARSSEFTNRLCERIREIAVAAIRELSLDERELEFLDSASIDGLNAALPAVAAFVSDTAEPEPSALAALDQVLKRSLLVLPVVPTLTTYSKWVPLALRAVNGLAPADPSELAAAASTVATRLLEELRLLRRVRRAFISYKRRDSSAVAEQLHEALERRRYEVFLDTFSVNYGLDFQSVLWDTMARTDLVVLLNTRSAFDSVWVEQEISRANVSGLGVLQLLWPEVLPAARPRGTEFAEPVYLSEADFEAPYVAAASARLTQRTLESVVTQAERLRARAQATRRRRVIAELVDAATRRGLDITLDRNGCARVSLVAARARQSSASPSEGAGLLSAAGPAQFVVPIVGPPDAEVLHDFWLQGETGKRSSILVYDALGVIAERMAHLLWLDDHLPQKAIAVQEIDSWFGRRSR